MAPKKRVAAPVEDAPSSPRPTTTPSSSFFSPHLAAFALVVAILTGFILTNKNNNREEPASPPASPKSPPMAAAAVAVAVEELIPSTEIFRGDAQTSPLQHALYDKAAPAVLIVTNYEATEDDGSFLDVFFNGEVKAVAPAKSKARLEAYIGQTFHIRPSASSASSLNVTLDRAVVWVKAAKDGSLARQQPDLASEAALPKGPKLPLFPSLEHRKVPPGSTAKSIKIRNLSSKRFNEYWVPGEEGQEPVYQGVINPNHESTTNSYIGHTFRFTSLKDAKRVFFEFTVNADQEVYAYVDAKTADKAKLAAHLEEVQFGQRYKQQTKRSWLSYYPHHPVKTFMWPADYVGQKFKLRTDHGPDNSTFEFTLEVVSVRPRAYAVDYFVSDAEAEYIISRAKARLGESSVESRGANGELVPSNTRTSKNAWMERGESAILDRIYRRVADLMHVPEESLHHKNPGGCAESLQVVHYRDSAHYAPHHDWGVLGSPHTRLATVLLYLNEPEVGGSTTFPKAIVGRRKGLEVRPKKGKAVLFYSQHPDGNVDDESLHEAEPVTGGEKWLANVWVHDKMFWGRSK